MGTIIRELLISSFGQSIDMTEVFPYVVEGSFDKISTDLKQFLYDCAGARYMRVVLFEGGPIAISNDEMRFKDPRDAMQFKLMI